MSEIYLFNMIKAWIAARKHWAENRTPENFQQIARWECLIENLMEQIERERLNRQHPSY